MRQLLAPTEDFIKLERSELAADATAGSNVTLTLINNDGIADETYVAIGWEGNELAELCQVNQAVSGATQIRVATLKFNHKVGEPIRVYRFNKRKFYGATTAGGDYTQLTSDGSPKDISVDDPMGTLLEYTGSTYEYFKATYFNSSTDDETSLDDATETDGDESKRYASIYAIRKMAGLTGNPRYSDARIEVKRLQAENEINSVLANRYSLPLAEVPPLLGNICELLAAGYIDFEEFGGDSDNEGVKMLGEARGILKAIADGRQILIGVDGTELTRLTNTASITSYPNDPDTDGRKFGMGQNF